MELLLVNFDIRVLNGPAESTLQCKKGGLGVIRIVTITPIYFITYYSLIIYNPVSHSQKIPFYYSGSMKVIFMWLSNNANNAERISYLLSRKAHRVFTVENSLVSSICSLRMWRVSMLNFCIGTWLDDWIPIFCCESQVGSCGLSYIVSASS